MPLPCECLVIPLEHLVEVELMLFEIGRCMVEVGMTTFGIGLLDLRTRYQEVFGQRNAR
jgi:hypothetical protein